MNHTVTLFCFTIYLIFNQFLNASNGISDLSEQSNRMDAVSLLELSKDKFLLSSEEWKEYDFHITRSINLDEIRAEIPIDKIDILHFGKGLIVDKVSYSMKQPTLGNSGFMLVNQETKEVIAVVLGK